MGKPLLLLRLEGPLQSWGLRSRWDVRDTGDEPSKSAIIGLLGCALGYPTQDPRLVDLDQSLTLGVRTERRGSRLVDFQTVTGVMPTAEGGKKGSDEDPYTVVSPRAYLQDAAFLGILAGPEDVLQRCVAALEHPRWPIYLGRKACPPTRPVFDGLVYDYEDINDALHRYPWDWEGRTAADKLSKPPLKLWCTLEDPNGETLRPDRMQANPARMYTSRAVKVFSVPFPGLPSQAGVSHVSARRDVSCT